MAQAIGTVATLTASWATIGTAQIQGNWVQNASGGQLALRLKHTKHGSQLGGYPMVRVRYLAYDVAGNQVTSLDGLNNGASITTSGGVATVECNTPELKILALTDSDGSLQYDVILVVPPYKTGITVQAKQAGDTTNFGTLVAELDGKI